MQNIGHMAKRVFVIAGHVGTTVAVIGMAAADGGEVAGRAGRVSTAAGG